MRKMAMFAADAVDWQKDQSRDHAKFVTSFIPETLTPWDQDIPHSGVNSAAS